MLSETLLGAVADAVFGYLLAQSGAAEKVRLWLKRDQEHLAFQVALARAYTTFARVYPQWTTSLFDEYFLTHHVAPLLARTLLRDGTLEPAELATAWVDQMGLKEANKAARAQYIALLTPVAANFLRWLDMELRARPEFQALFDSRALDLLATSSQQALTTLESLRADLTATLSELQQATRNQAAAQQTLEAGFGDPNRAINHSLSGIRELPTDYATRVRNFLTEYLGVAHQLVPFGGRSAEFTRLDTWLDERQTASYLLLAAPAGRGKSALLARWSQALLERTDLAVAYFPVSSRFRTNLAGVVFPALTARLASLHNEKVPTDLNTPQEVWRGLLTDYLARPLLDGRRLVVILDGVDEAADWEVGAVLFPLDPPPGLRVILSARYLANDKDATAWLNRLGWTRRGIAHVLSLNPLDQAGIADVLRQMASPLDRLSTDVNIVTELHRLSEGDPLLVRLYVDDLGEWGEMAPRLQVEDLRAIPPGLTGYFDRWWEDQRRLWGHEMPLREPAVQALLNALSCAFGPLTRDDLLQLAPPEAGLTTWTLETAIEPMKRFVIGDGHQGYVFSHSRLAIYFSERLSEVERQQNEHRFLHWGQRTLEALTAGHLPPKGVPAYLVQYYGVHLEHSAAAPGQFVPLASGSWSQAWNILEGSYAGFLNDVARVWRAVERVDQEVIAANGPAPFLGDEVRCALCHASIISLTSNIPPRLIAALVKEGIWSPAQGLAYARQKPDSNGQSRTLVTLAPHLPPALLNAALEVAHSIPDEFDQVEALTALVVQLPLEKRLPTLQRAIQLTRAIPPDLLRSMALARLVPHLPHELLDTALEIALSISSSHVTHRETITTLFSHLPSELLGKALEHIRSRLNEREEELIALAPYLTDALLHVALDVAYTIRFDLDRVRVLAALSGWLSPEERVPVLRAALDTACAIESASYLASALTCLAPLLPPELVGTAFNAALSIQDNPYQESPAQALVALIPRLPAEQVRRAFNLALTSTLAMEDKLDKVKFLVALSTQAPPEERLSPLLAALETLCKVETFGKARSSADAMKILAPHLPAELLNQALEITLSDAQYARALVALVPYLSPTQLNRALSAAYTPENRRDRADVLSALVARLPAEERFPVLQAALAAQSFSSLLRLSPPHDLYERENNVFEKLIPSLSPELHALVTEAALSIDDEETRLLILMILVAQSSPEKRLPLVHAMLETARTLPRASKAEELEKLVPYLPRELLGAALDAARPIRDEKEAAIALAELAALLPVDERPLVVDALFALKNPLAPMEGLTTLAARVSQKERPPIALTALEFIRSHPKGVSRVQALEALVPHLPPELLRTALEMTLTWPESERPEALIAQAPFPPGAAQHCPGAVRSLQENRTKVLLALIPYLPHDLLGTALEIARSLEGPPPEVLAMLASELPPEEFLFTIRAVLEHPLTKGHAIYAWPDQTVRTIASRLSPQQMSIALEIVGSFQDERRQTETLAALGPYLPPGLLDTALAIARSLQTSERQTKALVALAPHFSHQQLQAVFKAARELRQLIITSGREYWRGRALIHLAPHLPREFMREALMTRIDDEVEQARLVEALAPRLPYELRTTALKIVSAPPARRSSNRIYTAAGLASARASALRALAPHLSSELLSEALNAAYQLQDARSRIRALTAFGGPLASLSPAALYPLWHRTLHLLAVRNRADLLTVVAAFVPVIAKLGSQESLLKAALAIVDAAHWWP